MAHASFPHLLPAIALCVACTTPDDPAADSDADAGEELHEDCDDDDPLTNRSWAGFCGDRVDDNCTIDDDPQVCNTTNTNVPHPCVTGDEPCPATQPAAAPPSWRCDGPAPANVFAVAHFTQSNEQVASFCVYIYEPETLAGEFYIATDVRNGTDSRGPDNTCGADMGARRHVFMTDTTGTCAPTTYVYPAPVDEQPLSTPCRKAVRNLAQAQAAFDPDISYLADNEEEVRAKLAALPSAEVGCIGIDNSNGEPRSDSHVWVSQATAEFEVLK